MTTNTKIIRHASINKIKSQMNKQKKEVYVPYAKDTDRPDRLHPLARGEATMGSGRVLYPLAVASGPGPGLGLASSSR